MATYSITVIPILYSVNGIQLQRENSTVDVAGKHPLHGTEIIPAAVVIITFV